MKLMSPFSVTVYRPKPNILVDGVFQPSGDPEVFENVKCNIQPFRFNQKRDNLPEGFKIDDCVSVFSQTFKFKTSSVYSKTSADYFEHKGFTYVAYQEQDWDGYGLKADHSRCLAVKKDVLFNGGD